MVSPFYKCGKIPINIKCGRDTAHMTKKNNGLCTLLWCWWEARRHACLVRLSALWMLQALSSSCPWEPDWDSQEWAAMFLDVTGTSINQICTICPYAAIWYNILSFLRINSRILVVIEQNTWTNPWHINKQEKFRMSQHGINSKRWGVDFCNKKRNDIISPDWWLHGQVIS